MRKTKLKHLLLLLFAFAIWSCTDDYETNEGLHNHNHNYSIKKYTYKQALKLQKFGTADKIAKQSLNLKFGKINVSKKGKNKSQISKDASSILAIDSILIKEVSTGDITSYTMLVVLDSVDYSDGSFDNLVIQTNKSNETNAYIIHYTPSEEIKYNETHNSYSFEGTTQVSKVYGTTSFFGGSGLGNNGDNGNLGDDSNEGGTSNNAESSVICTTVILCNYEYVHIAGPGCKNTYSKTECYTNPNYNPWNNYSSGSGNEPEDEIGQNNNTGPSGGGMGSGGNTTNPENPITSTVFTEELYEEDVNDDTPCQTLKKQSIDNAQFAHKLDSLKQRVLSSNPNHDTTETLVNISRSGDDYSYKVSGSVSFGGGLTTVLVAQLKYTNTCIKTI